MSAVSTLEQEGDGECDNGDFGEWLIGGPGCGHVDAGVNSGMELV